MNHSPEIIETLKKADWIVANTSGGKDSQTLLEEVAGVCDSHGIPRAKVVAVHCDLGEMEHDGVVELARLQADHYGFRFEAVSRRTAKGEPQSLLEQVEARGKWPSRNCRYCTSDQKRDPARRVITMLGGKLVVNCLGMRAEESPARSKLVPWEINRRASTKSRTVWNWLPIHDLKIGEVWARIKASSVPYHPAYAEFPRLSCRMCIFMPFDALVLSAARHPVLFAKYLAVQRKIGHKFRLDADLEDVDQAVRAGRIPLTVTDWSM